MQPPHGSPRQDEPVDGGGHLLRLGVMVGLGFLAAVIGTAPAALRLMRAGSSLVPAWSVLAAAAFVPCIALVALFRGARVGATGLMGGAALEHGASVFLFSSVVPLALATFGAVLRAKNPEGGRLDLVEQGTTRIA